MQTFKPHDMLSGLYFFNIKYCKNVCYKKKLHYLICKFFNYIKRHKCKNFNY
jgi:hypothetical protein